MAGTHPQTSCARIGAVGALFALAVLVLFLVNPPHAAAQQSTGAISGTVSAGGAPLPGVIVTAELDDGSIITTGVGDGPGNRREITGAIDLQAEDEPHTAVTDVNGNYTIAGLPAQEYTVRFDAVATENWASEYYDNTVIPSSATTLTLDPGETIGNVNADLAPGATITGTVTKDAGGPAPGVCVTPLRSDGALLPSAGTTASDGTYSIPRLPAGTYTLEFDPCAGGGNLIEEWWDDAHSADSAASFTLVPGQMQTADAALAAGGSISGTVTSSDGTPINQGRVRVYRENTLVESRLTNPDGTYAVDQLASGDYKVEFVPPDDSHDLPEFYDGARLIEEALPVPVVAGSNTPGIDASLNEDDEPPEVAIQPFPALTSTRTPSFRFDVSDSAAEVSCAVTAGAPDESDFAPCSTPPSEHSVEVPLADGDYTFTVIATDPAGNAGQDAASFAVDATPPDVQITGGPTGATQDRTPTFTFTAAEGTPSCSVDQGTPNWGPCSGATAHTPGSSLSDGAYVFRVRSFDEADNAGADTQAFIVDNTPPAAAIQSGPDGPTNDITPSFGFSNEAGATALCSIDDASPAELCTTASTFTSAPLPQGPHTFYLYVEDSVGNGSLLQREFTIDTQAPNVSIDSAPSGTIPDPMPSFEFTADEGDLRCSLVAGGDSPVFGTCSDVGSHSPPGPLADGSYTFAVRATDAAGNADVETVGFTVDTSGPQLTIVSGPHSPTNDAAPSFSFDAGGDTVELDCAVDPEVAEAPTYGDCSTASSHDVGPLADGNYVLRVRAVDSVGNVTVAQRAFTVDTQAPQVQVIAGPTGITDDPQPLFEFVAEGGATMRCSISSATPSFGACSGLGEHRPPQNLADGSYEFVVRATDAAGNSATAARAFRVNTVAQPPPPPSDSTAPTVKITSGALGKVTDRTPRFGFSSDDPSATFLCAVDRGPEVPCVSPLTLKKLKIGKHTFAVTAVDAAGNRSVADARSFKVAKKKRKRRR